jgi:hypothetical protein
MASISAFGMPAVTLPDLPARAMAGPEARRFLEGFAGELQGRVDRLNAADSRVEGLESDLRRQLAGGIHVAGGLGEADYAAEFRQQHAQAYREADAAAGELWRFVAANVSDFAAAVLEPQAGATPSAFDPAPPALTASASLGQAVDALKTHAELSAGGPRDEASASGLGTAVGVIETALSEAGEHVGGQLGDSLTRAAGGFGMLGGALAMGNVSATAARGQTNAGTWMQGGAAGLQVGTGLARLAGFAVPFLGQIETASTVLDVGGSLVSARADEVRNQAQATAVLTAKDVDATAARAIAGAGADTLAAFQAIGLSPEQVQAIAKASPAALGVDGWGDFLAATGLRGDALVGMMTLSGDNGPNLIGQVASLADRARGTGEAPIAGRADLVERMERSPVPMMPVSAAELDFLRTAP